MAGEFERIARIERIFARTRKDVLVGIGDDAAVLAPSSASPVLSVDAAVEDVHFRRAWLSFRDIGYRAFMAAASDLAAMAAEPRTALLSLILPTDLSDDALFELCEGSAEAADACGMSIVGGNLSGGRELSITTTVIGEVQGHGALRSGASVGDRIYVTGELGSAALGLAALQAGRGEEELFRPFVERWRRPRARLTEARALRDIATAMIDVSDGLLQDLGHLLQASGVGAEIDVSALPHHPDLPAAARALGLDLETVLGGGEDYELVFTAAPDGSSRSGKVIGTVREATAEGASTLRLTRGAGFDHFLRSNVEERGS